MSTVQSYTSTPGPQLVQFLVDPSVLPLVITLRQEYGEEAVASILPHTDILSHTTQEQTQNAWHCVIPNISILEYYMSRS